MTTSARLLSAAQGVRQAGVGRRSRGGSVRSGGRCPAGSGSGLWCWRGGRTPLAALVSLLALATACGGPPSAAVAPAASSPAAAPTGSEAPTEALGRRLLALQPAYGRAAGLHEYDGRVADVSAAGIEGRIATLRQLKAELDTLEAAGGSADDALDRRMLGQMIAQDLFDLTEVESWRTRPAYYSELFSVEEYIVRDYAPKEQRARAMLEHLTRSHAQVEHVLRNLRSPLSEPVVRTAIDIFKGFGQYLRGDVQAFLDGVADAALASDAKRAAKAVGDEADRIALQLERVELPKADQSHVLGRQRYEHLLLAQEALTTPIEDLERLAEQDLQRNEAAYDALAKSVHKTRPEAGALLEEARRVVLGAQGFIVDRRLVTLPVEPHVQVKESPPYMRWNSAFLNAGGAFDAPDLAAYYYVTLPDPTWPAKEQAEYVMSRGEIVSTSVHEVFPGHYLQALWQRNAPTFVQKVTGSYSFVEGWAHYVEQMMIDEGFESVLPEARLGQLSDALLRDCRFVASIAIHVRGTPLEEVKRRFREDCKQDDATARQQAVRGTFDPGYFAYTLGKLQILALREEARQKLGANFDLRRFHDALLAHGAPPIPLLHDRVLADLGAP
jgi:uncharacterized protein (DUF885 family)